MRRSLRWFSLPLAGLIALGFTVFGPFAQAQKSAPWKIAISAQPIESFARSEPDRKRFDALEFRGGLFLSSNESRFGGLSGIRFEADGEHFLAITDRGFWLRGRLKSVNGRPVAVTDAEMAPMLAAGGGAITERGWYDTESLAADGEVLYVGIERVHRILRFEFGKGGLLAPGQPINVPAAMRTLPNNQGIEGLVFVPKGQPLAGTLIALSERSLDTAGNIRGFLIGGALRGEFAIRRSADFDITDAALTPGGDLLILERHFSWRRGVGMRIRRIPLAAIKPGALVDGPVLIEAGNGHQIDNMEGIAAHRDADGATIITIVSDDNFNPLQRTILLRFALLEE